MLGWTPSDLKLISDEYLSTSQYRDQASDFIRPLLDKYEILGREIGDLSQILERSARQPTQYSDPDLNKHIREAKIDIEKHFSDKPGASVFKKRLPIRRLNSNKIAILLQQAGDHIKDARDFKIGFLLDTRLEPLLFKEPQDGRPDISRYDVSQSILDHRAASHPESSARQRPRSASDDSGIAYSEEHDTESLVGDASGSLQIARVVWKNMADISSKDRDRHRRSGVQSSAKHQYVLDVAELIENAELYTAGINKLDEISRRALEEIVSKTMQLKNASGSPIVPALTRDANANTNTHQAPHNKAMSSRQLKVENYDDEEVSLTTKEQLVYTPLQLPPNMVSDGDWGSLVGKDTPQTETHEAVASFYETASAVQTPAPASLHIIDNLSHEYDFPSQSIAEARDKLEGIVVAQISDVQDHRGWIKISSQQLRLQPTTCKLTVDEFGGEVHIEAIVLPRSMSISSYGESNSSADRSSNPISFEGILSQGSLSPYIYKFKHFLKAKNRSIPTVKHPKYEGFEKTPTEPFTITFTEPQLIAEEEPQDELRTVQDLKYIFSHIDDRDDVRALLFGKKLLASTGVAKIEFDHIACLRQSLSLWRDKSTGCKTITFLRQHPDRKHKISAGEVEYEIIGIEESKRSRNEEEESIVLYVKLLSSRCPRQRCSIFFSDILGKTMFMNILSPP